MLLLNSIIFRVISSQAVFVGAKTRILYGLFPFINEIIFLAKVVVFPVPGGPKTNSRLFCKFSFKLKPSGNFKLLKEEKILPNKLFLLFMVIDAFEQFCKSIFFNLSLSLQFAFSRKL